MKTILFLHDTNLNTPRGAELTIKSLISLGKTKKYQVLLNNLKDFKSLKLDLVKSDLVILNGSSKCTFELELLQYLLEKKIRYVKVEYDYNFCVRRNILCTITNKITNCCNNNKFHLYRNIFSKSVFNVFQSPKHYQSHVYFYGEAVKTHLIMPPTVSISNLKPVAKKQDHTIPFFGDLSYLKGGNAYLDYAKNNTHKKFVVYGRNLLEDEIPENVSFHDPISNTEVLEILGKTKTFFCKPVWPEPSGRLAAEAFLSGCNILSNENIGTFSFNFYPNHKAQAAKEMEAAPEIFWDKIDHALKQNDVKNEKSLGNVLVYKSYGGLGDIFFAIPAINKLALVSSSLHFAVAPRLVSFFKMHLTNINVVNEEEIKKQEADFDNIYELGNYPAFRGYDLDYALKYPTHKKVKQHAINHYIDTVSKLHKNINNSYDGYPYFETKIDFKKPYYVIHHGAGFLLKIWPTHKFAKLIEELHKQFPNLECKIIKGPNDPDIETFFSEKQKHVQYITGGMEAVGEAMSGALFHIGNDAGITHVAGAFNVPTVGIYGPTGPGSWGSFSENNELIWGKKGVCNIRCNYDVILNCEHRICLTSTTTNRVKEALYKVLQRSYNTLQFVLKINPEIEVRFHKKDCIITLRDNSFLLDFHDETIKADIENLLKHSIIPEKKSEAFQETYSVLKQQNIVFEVPVFH